MRASNPFAQKKRKSVTSAYDHIQKCVNNIAEAINFDNSEDIEKLKEIKQDLYLVHEQIRLLAIKVTQSNG